MHVDQTKVIAMLKRIHFFRGVDEARLQAAVKLLEPVELESGSVIFRQGDAPDYFYFILNGRVRTSRKSPGSRQDHLMGYYEEDDTFGNEVLELNWPRQVTATAETDVVLMRLSVPNFIQLIEMIPPLAQRLQMVLDNYRMILKTQFAWTAPDETLYFVDRKHMVYLWGHILPPTLFGLLTIPLCAYFYLSDILSVTMLGLLFLSVLITLTWWLWGLVDWSNDYYIVTNRRVVYKERVLLLYDRRQEAPLAAIQSTSTNTSQLGRIMGYGNVAIRTYIGTILFRGIANPQLVMALIQEQQMRAQTTVRREEYRNMESAVRRVINQEPVILQQAPKSPPPKKPGALQLFLSDLFHLRYEIDGTILYRKHWSQLIKRVWLQSLILFGLLILCIASLINPIVPLTPQATLTLGGMIGLGVFLWWLYDFMDWHNDVYLITADQIVDVNKKPLGREERRAAPLKNILSIEYERLGLIGLLLNFGTVYIRVGDQELTFDYVYNPSEVQRELFDRLARKNFNEKKSAAESERQRLAEWIATYHRLSQRSQAEQVRQQQEQEQQQPAPRKYTRSGF